MSFKIFPEGLIAVIKLYNLQVCKGLPRLHLFCSPFATPYSVRPILEGLTLVDPGRHHAASRRKSLLMLFPRPECLSYSSPPGYYLARTCGRWFSSSVYFRSPSWNPVRSVLSTYLTWTTLTRLSVLSDTGSLLFSLSWARCPWPLCSLSTSFIKLSPLCCDSLSLFLWIGSYAKGKSKTQSAL